jgi:thiol-disulfide isomerase/thioredoxin
MKKVFVTILSSIGFFSMAQYTIKGDIKGLPNGTNLYLAHDVDGALDTVYHTVATNGQFVFKGKIPLDAEVYFFCIDTGVTHGVKTLFLVNAEMRISSDLKTWPDSTTMSGSIPNDEYYQLMHSIVAPFSKVNEVSARLSTVRLALYKAQNCDSCHIDTISLIRDYKRIEAEENSAIDTYQKTMVHFVETHLNSLYTPNLIARMSDYLLASGMQAQYDKLTTRSQNSFYGLRLQKAIANEKIASLLKIGSRIPEFSAATPDNKMISVHDVYAKNKLTLLDFWASWCTPCRFENPSLRRIFKKYHDRGFEILSISDDAKVSSWKTAIKKDSMVWVNVIRNAETRSKFQVSAIPAFILIDQQGTIVGLDLPGNKYASGESLRGEDLEIWVKKYLGGE